MNISPMPTVADRRFSATADTLSAPSLPLSGVRNTSDSRNVSSTPLFKTSERSESRRSSLEAFGKAFGDANVALQKMDRKSGSTYDRFPFLAMDLRTKMEEYDSAAQRMMALLSATAHDNDPQSQRQELNRLVKAIHALIDAFPEWEQRNSSSPTLRDFLHTLTGKPSPLQEVQRRLGEFSVWLQNKSIRLGECRNATGNL